MPHPVIDPIIDPTSSHDYEENISGAFFPQSPAFSIPQIPHASDTALAAPSEVPPSPASTSNTTVRLGPDYHFRNQVQFQSRKEVPEEASNSETSPHSPGQKRRGHKPKRNLNKPRKARLSRGLGELDSPDDAVRRRILEGNRNAATKCRLRKQDEALQLASRAQALQDENLFLHTYIDYLKAEKHHLKSQLLQHANCNCALMTLYIAKEAQSIVETSLPPLPQSEVNSECNNLCSRCFRDGSVTFTQSTNNSV